MKTKRTWIFGFAAVGMLVIAAPAAPARAQMVAQTQTSATGLEVEDVQRAGATVTGWVVNHTGHEAHDVRLMVENDFRWARERSPGDDNPGRSTVVRLPEPIPPNGKVRFRYDMPPLPARSDGHFVTDVKVLSFTERWLVEPAAAIREVSPPPAVP